MHTQMYMQMRELLSEQTTFEILCPDPEAGCGLSAFSCALLMCIADHESSYSFAPMDRRSEPVIEPWIPENMPSAHFEGYTAFPQENFIQMVELLTLLPAIVQTRTRNKASLPFVIFVMLMRWHTSFSWQNMERILNVSRSVLCDLYMEGVQVIYRTESYQLLATRVDFPRIYSQLQHMCDLISTEHGGQVDYVLGFVDGSARKTCRPKNSIGKRKLGISDVQRLVYNDHYGHHGLKLQFFTALDAICAVSVQTINDGDNTMLKRSGLIDDFRAVQIPGTGGEHPRMYGDPAYQESDVVERKAKGARSTEQEMIDTSMIAERANVEDAIGNFSMTFPFFTDALKHQLLRESRVSYKKEIVVATLFLNLRTCLCGSQVSGYYTTVECPSMADYLQNANAGVLEQYYTDM
jgi:hypothetical protein